MEEQTLQKTDWFNGLIDDCKGIVTESEFTSRWTIIQGYHELGKRISQEKENFTRSEIYGKQIVKLIAEKINKSESSVDKAMRFYEKYPNLDLLPEGKDVSWYKITKKYLPTPKEKTLPLQQAGQEDKKGKEEAEDILPKPTIDFVWNNTLGLWTAKISPEDMKAIDVVTLKSDIEDFLHS